MREAKVVVDGVTKRFGELVAVDNVSFEVYRGEIFSLLGPSGCGKTTTLRIISGLERPDTGRVYIGGRDVTALPPQERNVCLVFQEYAVFPHMSVFDNIAFGLKVRRLSQNTIHKIVGEIAEKLELSEYLNAKAGRLGLSEQQKVALARCIVVEPEVLLLDEPLTLADAKVRERMRRELKILQRDIGITMIYVTHDQLEALMLSDRIAVMNRGRIVQVGPPSLVYDRPQHLFVAQFVGSPTMNFIDGRLARYGDRFVLVKGGRSVDVTGMSRYFDLEGLLERDVVIGIRPEDVYIDSDGIIEGSVEAVEIVGERAVLHVRVAEDVVVKVLTPLYTTVGEGERLKLSFNLEKVHIFDSLTGERIGLHRVV